MNSPLEKAVQRMESLIPNSSGDSESSFNSMMELLKKSSELLSEDIPLPQSLYGRVSTVFTRLVAISKVSSHANEWYNQLRTSTLPFTKDVLKFAVYHEPDYNSQGEVIKEYILKILKLNQIYSQKLEIYFDTNIKPKSLRQLLPNSTTIAPDDLIDVQDAIIYSVSPRRSNYAVTKALIGAQMFPTTRVIGSIDLSLRQFVDNLERLTKPRTRKERYTSLEIDSTIKIASTLADLTNIEGYNRIELIISAEENFIWSSEFRNAHNYPRRFSQVRQKMKEELSHISPL